MLLFFLFFFYWLMLFILINISNFLTDVWLWYDCLACFFSLYVCAIWDIFYFIFFLFTRLPKIILNYFLTVHLHRLLVNLLKYDNIWIVLSILKFNLLFYYNSKKRKTGLWILCVGSWCFSFSFCKFERCVLDENYFIDIYI